MSVVTVAVMTVVFALSTVGIAKVNNAKALKLRLKKPDVTDLVFVAVNNWNYVMRNNGSYMYDSPDEDENGNNAGGEFPRGSGITIVYAGGLYIGTIKNGEEVVSETEFATEFQPGAVTNSGVPLKNWLQITHYLHPTRSILWIGPCRAMISIIGLTLHR